MPGQLVKLRPVENVKIITHEFHREIFFHGLGIFNETMLLIACIFFFEFMPKKLYLTGIILWIVGCLIGLWVSGYHMWEYTCARSRYQGEVRHEMLELVLYMLSHLTYVVGCVLFLPWFYKSQTALMIGHAISSWLWIWGSICLVVAGHWNAIGFLEMATKLPQCRRTTLLRRCASVALTCTALGAALFLAGSFLFRPGFKNQCESPEAFVHPEEDLTPAGRTAKRKFAHMVTPDLLSAGADVASKLGKSLRPDRRLSPNGRTNETPTLTGWELNPYCVSIIEQGTLLYLFGCISFWIHSILSTVCAVLLHRLRIEETHLEHTEAHRRGSRSLPAAETGEALAGRDVSGPSTSMPRTASCPR